MSFLAMLAYLREALNCQGTSRLAKWHISSLWRPEPRQIEGRTWETGLISRRVRSQEAPSMSQHVPSMFQKAPADHAREVCWPSVMAPYLVSQIKHRDLKVPASTWVRCRWSQHCFPQQKHRRYTAPGPAPWFSEDWHDLTEVVLCRFSVWVAAPVCQ